MPGVRWHGERRAPKGYSPTPSEIAGRFAHCRPDRQFPVGGKGSLEPAVEAPSRWGLTRLALLESGFTKGSTVGDCAQRDGLNRNSGSQAAKANTNSMLILRQVNLKLPGSQSFQNSRPAPAANPIAA
jgi:hypothetical protein